MEVSQYNGLEINYTRDDNGGLIARDVKRDETLDCVVEYVWSDAAPVFTGTLETYCKENKDNLIDKMNKGHLITSTFNHPDSEAQDRNGKVERYIGL